MCSVVFAGQQVRILGENFTLEDEEDSKIGQVMLTMEELYHMILDNKLCDYTHDQGIT